MWIMLNDCFLSIVSKDCPRSSLLVRARRRGDIEKVFPDAAVKRSTTTDYLFRAVVPRDQVEAAMVGEVRRITYGNFKDSVTDKPLHDAYLRCWVAMSDLQPTRPYTGAPKASPSHQLTIFKDDEGYVSGIGANPPKKKRKKRRSIKRGR